MKEEMHKQQLMEYIEEILQPLSAENITFMETKTKEDGDINIWLVEMEDGEEYWLLEGVYPMNIYKKSGIINNVERAVEVHLQFIEHMDDKEETMDRFQIMDL